MTRRTIIMIGLGVLLWLAFWGCGIVLYETALPLPKSDFGQVDLLAYDSGFFLEGLVDIRQFFSVIFKHPFLMQFCLPILITTSMILPHFGVHGASIGALAWFAAVGVTTIFLLYATLRRLGVKPLAIFSALFFHLSCAHVWLLGGMAESFSISMALFVGVLLMVASGVTNWRAWVAMSFVCGSITISNVVKPALAWFVSVPRKVRATQPIKRIVLFGGALGLLGVIILLFKWSVFSPFTLAENIKISYDNVVMWFPSVSWREHLWFSWNSFWCDPFMLHEQIFNTNILSKPYETIFPHLAGAMILCACVWSVIVNWSRPAVRALVAMISFDIVLHLVIGWGIHEGQIYCGHWMGAVPILLALLPRKLPLIALPLGIILIIHNLTFVLS